MFNFDSMTLNLIGIVVGVLIVYDIYAYKVRGSDTTISVQMYEAGKKYPIIPFLLGVVFGHIFWNLG